jgi:hypothetical protein
LHHVAAVFNYFSELLFVLVASRYFAPCLPFAVRFFCCLAQDQSVDRSSVSEDLQKLGSTYKDSNTSVWALQIPLPTDTVEPTTGLLCEASCIHLLLVVVLMKTTV